MAKYSFEFKKKVVLSYLNGDGGYTYLSKIYDIPARSRIEQWVSNFRKYGDDGLKRSRKKESYSFEFKLHVVELYLSSEVSYQELALQKGLTNPALIAKWVNDFRIAGTEALRPKKKGRRKLLKPSNKDIPLIGKETVPVDTSAEHVKQLEDELLRLKIENAYLKELRRLRLGEEALLRKKRELSTASEENSN